MAEISERKRDRARSRIFFTVILAGIGLALALGRWDRTLRHEQIERGKFVWTNRCARCHTLLRTLSPRSPTEWESIVRRMGAKPIGAEHRQWLPDRDARAVIRYLQEANSVPGAYRRGFWLYLSDRTRWGRTFAEKCRKCHGLDRVSRRREDAGWVYYSIQRDRRRDVFELTLADSWQAFEFIHLQGVNGFVDLVTAGCIHCHSHRFMAAYVLGLDLPSEEAKTDTRGLFARRCFACHTESILDKGHSAAEWQQIVDRMRGKDPAIRIAEASEIVRFLAEVAGPGVTRRSGIAAGPNGTDAPMGTPMGPPPTP